METPDWLKRLEQESWQAELIISGLALYGTFQLPQYLNGLIDILIKALDPSQYIFGYFISTLLLLGTSILTTFFIIHFVLRAYWIGLIGLNSVFPDGYKREGGFYSKYYMDKMIHFLPPMRETISGVDKICSTLFSGAFAFSMIYGVAALTVTIFVLLYGILDDYVPTIILKVIVYALIAIVLVFTLTGMFATNKKFKEKKKLNEYYFLSGKVFGYTFMNLFFKPAYQIMITFYSNYKKGKSKIFLPIVFFVLASILSGMIAVNSNTFYFLHNSDEERLNKNNTFIHSNYYEDQNVSSTILNPIIPSEIIDGGFLKIFIPIFKNENSIQEENCGSFIKNEKVGEEENKTAERKFNLDCFTSYHQVFINGQRQDVEFLKYYHPNNSEYGIQTVLSTIGFQEGKNIVSINKLKNKAGIIYNTYEIPFWFSSN